ncbi:aspartate-semialdehyde dehydrogenase [Weissella diestrammenae]|uniref:Aspartate-semialdehyde dehydrogenase n=1 Tax=Weissella diestrammenae TaxID=1162633 RepID=A0A7G9T489_9LACO|nr:aspartate-semialdehyde dehydrogenase [Weissella diestrammenae]MCM0583443.1 aspartate-semialdehyde dehydrogenase [Weissella diestrammenae]QNN74914.1 aspartate-semialdehyde dehydrogenase [Weissella diestrammenae]
METKRYQIAILGATGAVGTRILEQLMQSTIPIAGIKLLASKKSIGKRITYQSKQYIVEEATPEAFEKVDIVLASAGGEVSKKMVPEAIKRGAVVIDNSSYWRMNDQVPLVVPEVNGSVLATHRGLIANPNCSTIQMTVALAPIQKAYGLKQVIVSTYQAASGAGQAAVDELLQQTTAYLKHETMHAERLPVKNDQQHYPLAFNLLPQIDVFESDDYTHEEYKMIRETKKILCGDSTSTEIKVTGTAVRVPVVIGHGEAIYFEVVDAQADPQKIRTTLSTAQGVRVIDEPKNQRYPQPLLAEGHRETFVGRIRRDLENARHFHMWVVSDNLLKGAAWNTVQIAEQLVAKNLVTVPENSLF